METGGAPAHEERREAQDETSCMTHSNQELDLYCEDCKLAVCIKCVLTKHKQHDTKDLSEAASEAKNQLKQSQVRLRKAVSYMTDEVTAESKELTDVQDKKVAMQEAIKSEHATLITMANKFRDVSLASLDTVSGEIESQVSKELAIKQSNLDELCQLQQQTRQAIKTGTSLKLLAVAQEMREGRGSPRAVENLTPDMRSNFWRPVLSREMAEDAIEQNIAQCFGSVQKVIKSVVPEFMANKLFSCGYGDDTEVFSLCPCGDGLSVWVSFAKEDAPCKRFDLRGASLETYPNALGKQSFKCRGGSESMYTKLKKGDLMQTYDKSQKSAIFQLSKTSAKEADIETVRVTPFQTEQTKQFSIKVGTHRAFDVDSSEQLFVVLEEAQSPGGQRKVLLYRRGQHTPVSTYTPPTAVCQPSDVCFYKLGGREVLLVADELGTDSVHVVRLINIQYVPVEGPYPCLQTCLAFDRYLAPSYLRLVQPTALNIDTQGRLWVACRGGAILTFTPIA